MISFKGRQHKRGIILQCVRWYVAYLLSYRDLYWTPDAETRRGIALDERGDPLGIEYRNGFLVMDPWRLRK